MIQLLAWDSDTILFGNTNGSMIRVCREVHTYGGGVYTIDPMRLPHATYMPGSPPWRILKEVNPNFELYEDSPEGFSDFLNFVEVYPSVVVLEGKQVWIYFDKEGQNWYVGG